MIEKTNTDQVAGSLKEVVQANALAMMAVFFWSLGFPAAEILLEIWNPLPVITIRIFLAVVVLVIVWGLIEGVDSIISTPWPKGIFIGMVGLGFSGYFFIKAQSLTDPVTVAVASAAAPAFAAILEVLLDGRKIKWTFVCGIIIAILGGVVAIGLSTSEGSILYGGLSVVFASFCYAWGTRASVKMLPGMTALGRTATSCVGALIFLGTILIFSITLDYQEIPVAFTDKKFYMALIVHAFFGIILSQWLYILAVSKVGVAVTSIHVNAAPFYVMIIVVLLGGDWSWNSVYGALLVGFGVFLANIK